MGSNKLNTIKTSMLSLNSWYHRENSCYSINDSYTQRRLDKDACSQNQDYWAQISADLNFIDSTYSYSSAEQKIDSEESIDKSDRSLLFIMASKSNDNYDRRKRISRQQEIDYLDKKDGKSFELESLTAPKTQTAKEDEWFESEPCRQVPEKNRKTRSSYMKINKQFSIGGISGVSGESQVSRLLSKKNSSWDENETTDRRRRQSELHDLQIKNTNRQDVKTRIQELQNDILNEARDLRYYFQHPYSRIFVSYSVIFCNFLLFAEDPISHSFSESDIPVIGNVFSFIFTKYPSQWTWRLIKILMWLVAIMCGILFGKVVIHSYILSKLFRLKMFRDDQGSWMTIFLTVIISVYLFSHVYNIMIYFWYYDLTYSINSHMDVTNSSVMKAAACGTWLGDLITALMVTDVMLQDNLYPDWAPHWRELWRNSNNLRIFLFWGGSIVATSVVVTIIVSDWISWDGLNHDFVSTTELSRAYLASFILVLDLIIVMQDWDFPHFTTTLHVNLPGFSVATLQWKYAEVDISGKWFNYGIIFCVMILDLNMWKNQIFYNPSHYGQYTGKDNKIRTVNDTSILEMGNSSFWTLEYRSQINPKTGYPYFIDDPQMNSCYIGYPLSVKWTAFIPSIMGMILMVVLISLYGRFPSNQTVSERCFQSDREMVEKTLMVNM